MKEDLRQYLIFTLSIVAIEVLLILVMFLGDGWCLILAASILVFPCRLFEVLVMQCWWLLILMNVLSFVLTAKKSSSAIVFSVLGGAFGGFLAMRKRNSKFKFRRATNYLHIAQIFLLYLLPIVNVFCLDCTDAILA